MSKANAVGTGCIIASLYFAGDVRTMPAIDREFGLF